MDWEATVATPSAGSGTCWHVGGCVNDGIAVPPSSVPLPSSIGRSKLIGRGQNYIWYRLSHLSTFEPTSDLYSPPVWSRRDAKRDWSAHYRRINRRDDLETPDAEDAERVRSGYQTPKEEKEARWREEAESAESGPSKQEARSYYKELGGRKARGKTGKAAARDRTGWEEAEDGYY